MSKAFLFHWNAAEAEELAAPIRGLGWRVEVEAEDGARGCKRVLADPPDAVVIYLRRLPSHGRRTASYLRSRKEARTLPIVFVDGSGEPLEKTKAEVPDATYATSDDVVAVLARLPMRVESSAS